MCVKCGVTPANLPNRYSALCWRPVTHAQIWASYSALYRFGRLSVTPRVYTRWHFPALCITNYPIGPNRTPSHSTSYFLPPTTGQSFILSLVCTLQTRSIIDIQEKLPISTQLRRIPLKPTRCSYQRYAPTAQSSDMFEQLWTYDQHWVHLITALIVADRRWVDLIAFNWRCRLPWTVCKINLIFKRRSSCLMP